MAKLADALDLGSSSERSEGSSPFIRTFKQFKALLREDVIMIRILLAWLYC
jgi:hypothetical protein